MVQKIVNGEIVEVKEEEKTAEEIKAEEEAAAAAAAAEEEEPELDDDGNPVEKKVEPWEELDDGEGDGDLGDMPVAAHVRYKRKKKKVLEKVELEMEALKKENAELKSGTFKPEAAPERPTRGNFTDEAQYYVALETYEDQMTALRQKRQNFQSGKEDQQRQYAAKIETGVNAHYERAAKIAKETGISPEVYQKTDGAVRDAVESVLPEMGDIVVDQAVTLLGKGSEKVLFYIGRNQAALDRFKSLLAEDKSGMKAMIFLGQQKERLTGVSKRRSNAPAPAAKADGDGGVNEPASTRKLKKAYDAAHKKGNLQAGYDAKKKARAAGADVSAW